MHQARGLLEGTLALALVFIVLFRNSGIARSPGSVPSTATCVPTPLPPTERPGPPTATPDRQHFGTIAPPAPTLTPYPISKTTDLSPELAPRDKGRVLVFHCDGTYELFLTRDPAFGVTLQPGDVVIYRGLPESAEDLYAPMPTPWPTVYMPTNTPRAYLGPGIAPPATLAVPTFTPRPSDYPPWPTRARTPIAYPAAATP